MQERDLMERDCLSFEGFCACVRLDIKHRLGNAEVMVKEVVKVNDVKKKGIIIQEADGSNVTPTIYLNELYTEYLRGTRLEQIERKIIAAYRFNRPMNDFDATPFKDWNWVKKRVVFRLISMELNREYIRNVPNFPYLDLAVIFCCRLDTEELGEASIPIFNSHLGMWGITAEGLYAAAMENTPRLFPPVIQSMDEVIQGLMGVQGEMEDMDPPMYVLSNTSRNFGSACILYKGVLEKFADRMGADLYILPSSRHEVILIPAIEKMDVREMDELVRGMNTEHLQQEEVLSNHVYRFIRKTGKITI